MANKYVTLGSYRKGIVNKRSNPDYALLTEELVNERIKPISETQYYYILNECIYNEDLTDFKIYYYQDGQETIITDYTINSTSAVITFDDGYNPLNKNLICQYRGGGSIVWAEDIVDLQTIVANMDKNTVYIDGSNFMTGDLKMGEGTSENPYKSITNVNLVDGVDISAHNHTGNTNGSLIPTAGIENGAIIEAKIANNAVTNTKISTAAVTNDKVRSETLTADKFNSTMIGNGLKRSAVSSVPNSVLQTNIDNSSITFNNGVMQVPVIVNLTGVVVPFAGLVAPSGWLLCDGKSYNIGEYQALFQVIRNIYGGDGVTTFKVPDFRGKTFWGGDTTNIGTNLAAGIPNHYHIFGSNGFHSNGGRFVSTNFQPVSGDTVDTLSTKGSVGWNGSGNDSAEFKSASTFSGCMITTLSKQSSTTKKSGVYGNNTSTVQPPAIQMMFIIKA